MNHHKLALISLNVLMLGTMLFGMIAPAAQFGLMIAHAQESTEEVTEAPSEEPTQPATEVPVETITPVVEVTDEPTPESAETVEPEITDEPAAEATDEPGTMPTDAATESPTTPEPPTAEPPVTSLQDDFEDENTDGWSLASGWALTADGDNMLLRGVIPDAEAVINHIDWPHLNLRARLRVQPGSTIEIHLRKTDTESYRFVLNSAGATALYRGDALLAEHAGEDAEITEAVWRTLTVQAFGPYLTASLDDVLQFTYEDSNALIAGAVAFVTGAQNAGAVDVDDVAANKLDAPPIATEPAPQPEVTEEATAEITQEPEFTPEVTEEHAPELIAVPVISADFESELAGWVASEGAAIVAAEDGNHALLMDSGDSLIPVEALDLGDLSLDARINFVNIAEGGLNIVFRSSEGSGYVLMLDATQTTLSRSDAGGLTPLMSVPAARAANTWHTLRVEAVGSLITVSVDGVAELTFTDESALLTGGVALAGTGTTSFLLDDVALYQMIPADMLASPTPLPVYTLTEETAAKLSDALYQTLSLYEAGDIEGALEIAESTAIKVLDEAHTVEVIVWPEQSNEALAPVVELNGGVIQSVEEKNLLVQIPLPNIIALVASSEVRAVRMPDIAASSSNDLSAALNAALQTIPQPHSLGMIGWTDWNTNNIKGAGVKIGVIDKSGTHRQAVIELVKAVAPSATVTAYTANNAGDLDNAIASARSGGNKIILITMDLGAHVSPGDGTGSAGSGDGNADNVYQAIEDAREAGRLVIVSAGNNTNGYVSFTHTAATTIPMTLQQGQYLVSVSWNRWGTGGNLPSTISGSGISDQNSPNRVDEPGYQFSGNCSQPTCNVTLSVGGNTGFYVQVQLNSPGMINTDDITGSTVDENAGNIGRPADSPFALAVGAVCSRQSPTYYPPMHDSSHGPIFADGGSGPGPSGLTNTRRDFKPDLVSLSHVDNSFFAPVGDPDCDLPDGPTGGFTGTSAAAAHVAGMAALLLSNASMNAHIANAPNPADALQDYLQTHTVDLFSPAGDGFGTTPGSPTQEDFNAGFDNIYGAGLTMLGSPIYDLFVIDNPLEDSGTAVFVGQGDPGSQQTGEFDKPYIHIAKAIAEAARLDRPDRIVLLPGEYVSGFALLNRTGLSIEGYNGLATIWVNDSYNGQAGIQIEGSTGITFDTLQFMAANPFDVPVFKRPTAIQFLNLDSPMPPPFDAGGSIIRSSTFSGFIDGVPIVINNVYGVSIFNSIFENINVSGDQIDGAAMSIESSYTSTDRVMIRGNTFRNITGTIKASNNNDQSPYESIIRIENSAVDLFSNFFLQANAEAVIAVENTASDGTNTVNIASNLFLNNTNLVVQMNPAPELRFINNTVVGQSSTIMLNNILRRTGTFQGTVPWAMHNNLFYNNPNYQITHHPGVFGGGVECRSLDTGVADTGARHNWIINTQASFGSGSTTNCDESLTAPQNNNIVVATTVDPAEIFIGPDPNFQLDANTDPLYYQVIQSADGIDAADVNLILEPFIDFAENTRSWDGDGDDEDEPDMGAFELVPLTAGPIEVVRLEDVFNQPNDRSTAFGIDLRQGVDGGFQPYNFKIKTLPLNYSTDPSDFCLGAGVRIQGNFAYYCPPPQFYTSETLVEVPDNIQFEYYAFDRASDQDDLENAEFSTVTVKITPVADLALSTPINYQFITEAGTDFRFRLRPWVRYNNFRFSELGTQRSNQSDYPFTYNTNITVTGVGEEGFNPNILVDGGMGAEAYIENQLNNPNPDGTITLQSRNGERGFIQFSYQVSDSHTPVGTMTNTIRLEVVGTLPDRGLHDDSSFSFRYNNLTAATNGWTAITNPNNINNTLHLSKKLDDIAGFDFVGESFVLYMQAQSLGSLWQLRLDDKAGVNPPLTWVKQTDGSWMAQADGYNCVTRATVTGNLISNNGSAPYTVSCDNLRDGEAHSVEIINKQARALAIDALAIMFETDPLLPGFHEVTEHDVFTALAGWTLVNDPKASGGKALAAPSDDIDDIHFRFSGTGIAIGTTLERKLSGTTYVGADYEICITPQVDTVAGEEICQNFDNSLGAGKSVIWNVFRPFYGYSYDPLAAALDVHEVRIRINELPNNARFVIDSIVVFGNQPTDILNPDNRTFEDDQVGPVVLSNGKPNSWSLNTANNKASNKSLTSLVKNVVAAGPFVGFQVADEVNLIHWYRQKGTRDSQNVLVCVDRGQGEGGIAIPCLTYNLRTAPNPLIIREIDFGGWGTAWTDDDIHTFEIFSLVNEAFNFDKVEAFNSLAPLPGGLFEDYVFAASNDAFGFFDDTAGNPLNGGSFQIIQDSTATKASGASVARTSTMNEGALFQMSGTGFMVSFTKAPNAGTVQICWLNALTTSVTTVETGGDCRIVNNFSSSTIYKVGYTISGLLDDDYTVTVKNLQAKFMQLDAVQIFGDPLPGNILTDDSPRYETSFVNRAAQDRFLYYGAWNSVSGTKASKYSGSNYDFILGAQGASVVFQTQDVDALRIVRTAKAGYANIQVCIDGPADCTDISATQTSTLVLLPDANLHRISIILTSTGRFELDAIDVFNSTDPLSPGLYEDDTPNLQYDANWTVKPSSAYTAGHTRRAAVANAQMLFYMEGSMLEIGTYLKVPNQMQVCFEAGIVTDPNSVDDVCQNFPSAGPFTARRVYNSGDLGGMAIRTVRVRNTAAQELLIDYVHVIDGVNPLSEGHYEESHPLIAGGLNGTWLPTAIGSASGGAYTRTRVEDDFLQFEIEGTGFGIGTFVEKAGSEMEVCYASGLGTDPTIVGVCTTFQNEASATNMKTIRAVTGLPEDSYTVRVTNINDDQSQLTDPPIPRDSVTNPPSLVIDFVEVYAGLPALLTVNDSGVFNQDAPDGDDSFMQLLPANRWATLTVNTATEKNYAAVVDDKDKLSALYAGASATFRVEVPANSSITLLLDNLMKDAKNSAQLQICIIGETSAISIECETRTTMPAERYQTVTLDNPTGSDVTRTISFSTLTSGYFRLDGFQLIQGVTLDAGLYEDNLILPGGLINAVGSGWATISNSSYTNGSVRQTTNPDLDSTPTGDYAQFEFHGTGFAIGTHIGTKGSEMRLCYAPAATFDDNFFDDTGEQCLDFQNEASATNINVLRSVVGLPEDTYVVGVLHKSDGLSNISNPPKPRPVTNPATLIIDYVLVYNESQPAVLGESGLFNQDATDGSDPFIQLLPANRWGTITGKAAAAASSQNFVSVVDAANRVVNNTAGTTAAVRVNVDSAEGLTLVLNTFASGSGHSTQLRYCVLNGATLVECNTLTTMPTNPNQVVRLANPGTYTVFFQTLTPGFFRIDGLQVIQGNTLVEGIYDNHFMSTDGLIDLNGTWSARLKVKNTFGGEVNRTQTQGADLTFIFEGTGFSIINIEDKARLRLEACFVTEVDFLINGFTNAICRLNSPTVTSGKFFQYGLSFYGLEPDTYVARVRVDQAVTNPDTQWFQVDGVVIFGDVTAQAPLMPGIYDDAALQDNPAVRFAPAAFWTATSTAKSGPPKGPWQRSEHAAVNSGAVMQVFVEGNTLTIYQQFAKSNSNNVSACLVVFGTIVNELQCNNLSQSGATRYFTPIAFYGLGTGQHQIIFENKSPKKRFNIDGIQVTP